MKKITIPVNFTVFDSLEELPATVRTLMEEAVAIRKKAYAPYSKFRVGAAIQLDNGKVVVGSNQENAAYPSGLCAERVAIFQAGALYPDAKMLTMAISATSDNKPVVSPIPPCGACRQSIAEYETRQDVPIVMYFMGETGEIYQSDSLQNLLPFVFDKNHL
ncbi:cytidine deaminase [Flavobacterium kingsejongi]|uniref:Cytidine deaminase n=1 Tax=Flavobacterium kingsejongi TaxID=1678728 RepID=A0A2S1LNA3_9FLAO|nr:cytidine deaminase [Flavobacterium kingsejongi]AWG25214.1 cytidine deaminase [Flavobacterium kingsejongi]